jgi:hypothetical protein
MKPAVPSLNALWILSSGYRDAGDAAFAIIRTKTYVGFIVFPCVFLYFRCVGLVAALLLKSRSSARLRSVEWFGFTLALTKSRARL